MFILLSPAVRPVKTYGTSTTSLGALRISSSRQILKPPAEIRTPSASSRFIRKNPDVASRTGVSPRAIRHANRDIITRDSSQLRVPPPRNVAAADHDVGAVALHHGKHPRHQLGRVAQIGIDHAHVA